MSRFPEKADPSRIIGSLSVVVIVALGLLCGRPLPPNGPSCPGHDEPSTSQPSAGEELTANR
jgi:hypothetical protein